MKTSKIYRFVKYYGQFFPIQINFFILISIFLISYQIIKASQGDTNSFSMIAILMCKIAVIFVAVVVVFSLMTVLISYIGFKVHLKKNKSQAIILKLNENKLVDAINLEVQLPFAYEPILGNVAMRFFYDDNNFTKSAKISEKISSNLLGFKKGLRQHINFELPDVKQYHFTKSILSFEDMLRLFSFKIHIPINELYHNQPKNQKVKVEEMPPKKTETEEVRIQQLRKVEGEYLNYKKFENSDDVRRIVWKLFAKNKELVVRIPETMDPFASHIYMYASFFNSYDFQSNVKFHQAMLNRYKHSVWSIFDNLNQKDYEVRYLSDQMIESKKIVSTQVRNEITKAVWQNETQLIDYFKPNSGSVLCIHSLTDKHELENILSKCDAQTNLFFIQLSDVFKSNFVAHWIGRIFLKPNKDELSSLKNAWPILPLKFSLIKHEKELLSIMKKYEINLQIIS